MTDSKKDPPATDSAATPIVAEAQKLLQEIKTLKEQADAQLETVRTAGANAGSEALLAFNAKKACEDHASAIAALKGTVEANAHAIATNKQQSDEALAALNTTRANVDGEVKAVESRRKEIDQSATNVDQAATKIIKAAEIGAARLQEVDTLKENTETTLRTATDGAKASAATAAESAKNAAASAAQADASEKQTDKLSSESTDLVEKISEQHQTASQHTDGTKALLTQAEADEANLKNILAHLAKSDEISTAHEKRVEELTKELQTLIASVEALLPGATSASLATSFNKQRSRFVGPQKQWLIMFVACIGALVLLALPNFISGMGITFGHPEQIWRNFILRLPILFPIVWLGIYAGRNYMMSVRMEEDYAYKEAISTAFEGYKREMEKIVVSDSENPTPITILCTNILRAIAERPGRIYEGKQRDLNLMSEVQGMIEDKAGLSKKKLATS